MDDAIQISQMCYTWEGQDSPIIAIDEWRLAMGETLFLYGPSGSGKSTLLNLLSGILVPQQGSIQIMGESFSNLSSRKRDNFRAAHLGVIFQQFNLIPYLSVAENIDLAVQFAQKKKNDLVVTREHLQQLLKRLSLPVQILDNAAGSLSVGQQQRVAIARALVHKPGLLIADEPTSALDSDSRDEFIQLFLEMANEYGSSVVFVSHDRSLSKYFHSQKSIHTFQQHNMVKESEHVS